MDSEIKSWQMNTNGIMYGLALNCEQTLFPSLGQLASYSNRDALEHSRDFIIVIPNLGCFTFHLNDETIA
jgi:hypothetical protein